MFNVCFLRRFIFSFLLLTLASSTQANLLSSLLGKDEPKFLPVEQAFPLTTHIEDAQLLASWNTTQDYYLYQHRIFLEQNGTKHLPFIYSQPGIEKNDETFGLITAFYGPLDVRFDLTLLEPGIVTLHHQGCADAGLCYPPQSLDITLTAADIKPSTPNQISTSEQTAETNTAVNDNFFANRSALAIAGLFFLLGLGLTFTPCVLPMVPILTSVVLGQGTESGKRGFLLSSTYVIGMAITYALAGVMVGLLGAGANIAALMQTPWVLSLFALLFVGLALSMFGVYDLQLPAALRNRLSATSAKQQGGRFISVFFIGVLSALIVSPCITAPLAAALVYISTTGDALLGGMALLALGLGMGTPLIALGTTGASILPKAGGWMDQVKIFFGVMLLAVAIWLIARFMPASISLTLWAILAIIYAIVLGALETASSLIQRFFKGVAWVLLLYGVFSLAGALMGNGNPLRPLASVNSLSSSPQISGQAEIQRSSPFYVTSSVTELEQKIKDAPGLVMVDLYADWCISCIIMEKEIFAQQDVQTFMADTLWLQLDINDNTLEQREFMQRFGIFGPPTILFFNSNQELRQNRIIGELTKEEFMQRVKIFHP